MARRLTRSRQGAVLAGVAAGFGEYLDVDPVLVRLVFVLLAFLDGLGLLAYAAAWVLMPGGAEAPRATPAAPPGAAFDRLAPARLTIGLALIIVGSAALVDRLGLVHWPGWARLETLWPLLLIAIGASLALRAKHRVPA